jgi:transcription antitermination factor NusA-like protein
LGYGNRNAPFTALVPVKNFQSIGETVDYLKKLDEFLTKGFFEIEIKKLLEGYQAAAKVARDTKEAKFIERKLQKMVKDAVQTSGSNVYPFAKSQE